MATEKITTQTPSKQIAGVFRMHIRAFDSRAVFYDRLMSIVLYDCAIGTATRKLCVSVSCQLALIAPKKREYVIFGCALLKRLWMRKIENAVYLERRGG